MGIPKLIIKEEKQKTTLPKLNVKPIAKEPEAARPPVPAQGGEKKQGKQNLWDRIVNTFKGSAKQSGSNYGNAATTLYATGQGHRDQQNKDFRSLHVKNLNDAKRDLQIMMEDNRKKPGTWTEKDLQAQRNIIEHESRFTDAGKQAGTAQRKATQAAWESMDRLAESGGQDIEQAKEGLGKVGRLAVDVGAAGLGMAGDVAAAALTGGNAMIPMAARGFGGGTQEARQSGATLGQQMAYGLGSAGISVATEKISNATKPFAKMFGKGVADDLVEDAIGKAVSRAAKTAAGKTALDGVLRAGAGFVGEGFEEFLEDVASPILKRMTYDPNARFDLEEAAYDFLVGGILGAAGGTMDVVGGAKGRYQNYTQQAKTQNIDRAYDTVKQKGMFSPEGRQALQRAVRSSKPQALEMPKLVSPGKQEQTAAPASKPQELRRPTLGSVLREYGGYERREARPITLTAAEKIARGQMPTSTEIKELDLQNPDVRESLERAGVELPEFGALGTVKERIRAAVQQNAADQQQSDRRQTELSGMRGQPMARTELDDRVDEILQEYHQGMEQDNPKREQQRQELWTEGRWGQDTSGQWRFEAPRVEPLKMPEIMSVKKIDAESPTPVRRAYRDQIGDIASTDVKVSQEGAEIKGKQIPRLHNQLAEPGAVRLKTLEMPTVESPVETVENRRSNAPLGTQKNPTYQELTQKPDVKVVDIREKPYENLKEQRKQFLNSEQAREICKTPVINEDTGATIFVTPKTFTHSFSNSGGVQLSAVKNIREIVRNSVFTYREPSRKATDAVTGVYTLFGAVRTDEGIQPVKLKVKEYQVDGRSIPNVVKSAFEKNGWEQQYASVYDSRVLVLEDMKKEGTSSSALTASDQSRMEGKYPSVPSTVSVENLLQLVNSEFQKYVPTMENTAGPVETTREVQAKTEEQEGAPKRYREEEYRTMEEDLESMPESLKKVGVAPFGSLGDFRGADFLVKQVRGIKSMRRKIKKEIQKLGGTAAEKSLAQQLAAGTITMDTISNTVDRQKVAILADYYKALNSGEHDKSLAARRRGILDHEMEKMEELVGLDVEYDDLGMHRLVLPMEKPWGRTFNNARDKAGETLGVFRQNLTTPTRILLKTFGDQHGRELVRYMVHPVEVNNGRQVQWVNGMLDQVRTFKDSKGVDRKLTKAERAYVQALVENGAAVERVRNFEKQYQGAVENVKNGWSVEKAAAEFGIKKYYQEYQDLESYAKLLETVKAGKKNTEIDTEISRKAAEAYGKMYDDLYDAINEFLVAHGYETIGFIKGYAPHLQPEEAKSPLKSALKLLGMDEKAMELPTSISGQTADLKPYKQYNPFFQERTSKNAEAQQDIVAGMEAYLQYLGNIFYHTDDIMRVRTMAKYLRKTYAPEEASEKIGWAEAARNYSLEDKISFLRENAELDLGSTISNEMANQLLEEYIGKLYEQIGDVGRYSEFVKFLDNYANRLAGKQSMSDRGPEGDLGRKFLNVTNWLNGKYGGAKIAYNVSSALNQMSQLPMAMAENGTKATAEAMKDFFESSEDRAAFVKKSPFLTGKKGIEWISEPETRWDKYRDKGFVMAEAMDSFTSYIAVRSKYNQLIEKGVPEDVAMRQADEYGRSLMGSRAKGEKPVLFDNKNPFWNVMLKFQLEVMNTWDHIAQDMPREWREMAKTEGKAAASKALAKKFGTYELYAFLLNQATTALYGGTPAPFDLMGNLLESLGKAMGLTSSQTLVAIMDRVLEETMDLDLIDDDDEEDRELNVGVGVKNFLGNAANDIPVVGRLAAVAGIGDQSLPMTDWSTVKDVFTEAAENGWASMDTLDAVARAGSEFLPGGNQIRKSFQGGAALYQGGVYGSNGTKLKYPVLRSPANIVKGMAFGRSAFPEADEYYASGTAPLKEKPTEAYKHLLKGGFDARYAYDVLKDIRGAETKAEAVDKISKTLLPDSEKMYLYQNVASQEGDRRAPQLRQMMSAGMDWNQINKAWQEYARLDSLDLKASEQATRFSRWVDDQHLNTKQKELVKDTFKFFSQIPAEAGAYETYTGAGLTPDESMKLVNQMNTLKPESGSEQVSTMQKAAVVLQSGLPENKTMAVLQEILPEGTAQNMADLYDMGVKPDVYLDYKQTFDGLHGDKDANGRDIKGRRKKDKALAMIDGMDLDADQKTSLYYASGYKSSTLDEAPWVLRGEGGYWAP